jgi:rhodanese-related sulfurtransferase
MKLLKDMFVILVAAGVLGAGVNLLHPRGFRLVGARALAERRIVQISEEEAKIKHDAGIAVFVDAREKEEYEYDRIPGAVNIPASDLPSGDTVGAAAKGPDLSFLRKPLEVVLYCDGEACGASETLAKLMIDKGYARSLYIITKGFPGWKDHGYPVERGGK